MSTLEIKDLPVSVTADEEEKEILRGVTLTIRDGETHAIMGPNGSGKSTLAYSIAGHPKYQITGGSVTLDGDHGRATTGDERARGGPFRSRGAPGPASSWPCSTRSRCPASRSPTSSGRRRPPSTARPPRSVRG